eukprot:NODE_21827_length_735_cov_1.889803.p2 GENE.NODE_21827_length_735_cov_1.889803~~NODE_21827_length_735_cov_1.889803.p2  ORF type:complete len:166 (+),score=22.58 NODE_21827_length_735_cov_1.889803:167-664(+)
MSNRPRRRPPPEKWEYEAAGLIPWEPEPCSELKPGEPCLSLYKHSAVSLAAVMPCPTKSFSSAAACSAMFAGKGAGEECPQITCPKALGVEMKLTCGGDCCPKCWAPNHVVAVDRHTAIKPVDVVPIAPQAPTTCKGVRCFKPICAPGFQNGHVHGDCCYSCVAR